MSLKEYATTDGAAIGANSSVAAADPDYFRIDRVKARIAKDLAQDIATALDGQAPATIVQIALRDVHPSATNPRVSIDSAADAELDESVRQVGIMQPVLVRPVRLEIDPLSISHYELVFGHRRYEAARRCALPSIPAMVRELDDAEAAQMQAIENLQRVDITVMEEARGYAEYIERHRITKDQLAEQIGKSRTYVYNRLKLATLSPAAARALETGKIMPEVATLIARVPRQLQDKALALISENHPGRHGEPAPFRWARDELLEKFSLNLKSAIFPTDDAELVSAAGACTTCPQRSGCAPEIYQDVIDRETLTRHWRGEAKGSAHVCMDPGCFADKKKAHLAREARALEAKGTYVVAGNAAKSALSANGDVKGAYVDIKSVRAEMGQIDAKQRPKVVSIQDPRTGKVHQAVKRSEIEAFGVVTTHVKKTSGDDSYRKQHAAAEVEAKLRTSRNMQLLRDVIAAAALVPRSDFDMRQIVAHALDVAYGRTAEVLAEVFDLGDLKEPEGMAAALLDATGPDQQALWLLGWALAMDVRIGPWDLNKAPTSLYAAAAHYGVPLPQAAAVVDAGDAADGEPQETA